MSDVELYSSITKWKTGHDMVETQSCFALNFGYNGMIPFPTLSVDVHPNLEQYGFERYYKCFYVIVGGQYVYDMENVMDVVEDVSDQFHGIRPIALFVMGKYTTEEINKLSLYTKDLTVVLYYK